MKNNIIKKMLMLLIVGVAFSINVVHAAGCDAILTTEAADLIKEVVGYIRIGVPILLIILCVVDFAGVIGSNEENAMKQATSRVIKRFIAAALVFFVPLIVGLILGIPAVNNALNLVDDPTCNVADEDS